jgi:hypothetical protein
MKRLLIIICGLVLMLVLGACSVSKAEEEKAKLKELKSAAEDYRENGELDRSITTYKKMLDIKEDKDIREILRETENELESVQTVIAFREKLYEMQKNQTRDGIEVSLTEMEYVIKDLRILIKDIEEIDTNEDTDISNYVRELKKNYEYETLKIEAESESFDDSGTSEAISQLDSSFAALSAGVMALSRNNINEAIDSILSNQVPDKYHDIK